MSTVYICSINNKEEFRTKTPIVLRSNGEKWDVVAIDNPLQLFIGASSIKPEIQTIEE